MLVILLLRLIKIISSLLGSGRSLYFTINSIDRLLLCVDEVQAIAELCLHVAYSLVCGWERQPFRC